MARMRGDFAWWETLRELRARRGMSQQEIASDIGITKSAWAMYERGERTPRDEVKLRISKYFDIPVQDLFFCAEQNANTPANSPRGEKMEGNKMNDERIMLRRIRHKMTQSMIRYYCMAQDAADEGDYDACLKYSAQFEAVLRLIGYDGEFAVSVDETEVAHGCTMITSAYCNGIPVVEGGELVFPLEFRKLIDSVFAGSGGNDER